MTVFRTAGNSMLWARAATLQLDGSDFGTCDYAGYRVLDVPQGRHVMSVYMPDAPGTCSLSVDFLGGREYYFEVQPRMANWFAGLSGALIPYLGGIIGTPIATALESAGKSCGGAFAINAVDELPGRQKVNELRASN